MSRVGRRRARERILDRFGDPEPAAVVEVDVDRLVNVRLGRDQLDLEAVGDMKAAALLFGRTWSAGGNMRILRG